MLDFEFNRFKHLILFAFIVFVGFWNLQFLFPIIFVVLFSIYRDKRIKFSIYLLDSAFLILLVTNLISYLFSFDKINSINLFFNTTIIVFIYLFYKHVYKLNNKRGVFSYTLFLLSFIIITITILLFWYFSISLKELGFTELNNFKNLYTPFGFYNNIWVSVLILFLPFNLIFFLINRKKWFLIFFIAINVFSIISSFSRGAYLSLATFIIMFNILSFFWCKKIALIFYNIAALIILLGTILIVRENFIDTVSFNTSVSQQRSNSGRILQLNHSKKLLYDYPFAGWGQNNLTHAFNKNPNLLEDRSPSALLNNYYIQVYVENGILGILSLLYLFFVLTILMYRNLKSNRIKQKSKIEIAIVFSGIVSLLMREMTFSSIFNNSVYFLFFHLIFLLTPYDFKLKEINVTPKWKFFLFACCILVISVIFYGKGKQFMIKRDYDKFANHINNQNFEEGLIYLDKAIILYPNNINLKKNKINILLKKSLDIKIINDSLRFYEIKIKNILLIYKALILLKKIEDHESNDNEVHHNLAWVYFSLNQDKEAEFHFIKAIEVSPYNSINYLSYALFCLTNGRTDKVETLLCKALRFSPEILESTFYKEFKMRFQRISDNAQKKAINELEISLNTNNSIILKSRLARLLLDNDPVRALNLYRSITKSLPNLNRPWLYRGLLEFNLNQNLKLSEECYKKAAFLDKTDYLPKLYLGNHYLNTNRKIEAIKYLKEALMIFNINKKNRYTKSNSLQQRNIKYNGHIPDRLIDYITPDIDSLRISKILEHN